MISIRWILSVLSIPFLWRPGTPLVRPNRIDWNPSLSPQTVQIKGRTIFYVVKGEGKPLLLIHGYGAGIWVWEKQIEILSHSYRVYALDLIGYGFSDRPKIDYTAEVYIHFVRDFMDGVGMKRATLIGNSMGGGIAWAMAALFPERVEKLILINCIPPDILDQVRNDSFRTLVAIKDIFLLPYLIIAGRSSNSVKLILQECVSDIKLITPEILNRQYQLSKIKGTTWVLYSTFKNAGGASKLKDCLSQIHQPTLLIWGEKDLIFPPSVGEGLHRIIKNSKIQIIKGSGHIPMWETPEEVNQVILDFLKE
ncbi:MAG: alpha/beta hydrolase [Thermodesulfobacteriota bacterium]|nr:alpha/beta hydrolase [Thermodesulfobacteriota bacterium]